VLRLAVGRAVDWGWQTWGSVVCGRLTVATWCRPVPISDWLDGFGARLAGVAGIRGELALTPWVGVWEDRVGASRFMEASRSARRAVLGDR
jgi:hypothetical protein